MRSPWNNIGMHFNYNDETFLLLDFTSFPLIFFFLFPSSISSHMNKVVARNGTYKVAFFVQK